MKRLKIHLITLLVCLITWSTTAQTDYKVIGYSYNLYAIQATRLNPNIPCGDCNIKGGTLLDPRKSYTSGFERDEYFLDDKKILAENEVFKIPGYFRNSEVKKRDIEKYFMAFKLGNQWKNHHYDEIIEHSFRNQGASVGCNNCNFKNELFDDENNCIIHAYYEIRPIYKDGIGPQPQDIITKNSTTDLNTDNVDVKGVQLRGQIDQANDRLIKAYEKLSNDNISRNARTNLLLDANSIYSDNVEIIKSANDNYQEKIAVIVKDNIQFIESADYISAAYDAFLNEVEYITNKKYNKYDSKRKLKEVSNKYFNLASKIPFENKAQANQESKSIQEIKRETRGEGDRIEPIADSDKISYHVLFKVIGNPDETFNELKGIGDLYRETFNDLGTTRYLMGSSDNPRHLKKYITPLKNKGYNSCYIVEYKNATLYRYYEEGIEPEVTARLDNDVALKANAEPELKNLEYRIDHIFNDDEFSYHILFRVLGSPTEDFPELRHIGPLYRETFDTKGSTRYLIGNSETIEGARKLVDLVVESGFKSAYIAEYRYGKLSRYVD